MMRGGPLIGGLPLEFKQLGFSVHRDLDQIALDAESLGDRDHTLKQFSHLTQFARQTSDDPTQTSFSISALPCQSNSLI